MSRKRVAIIGATGVLGGELVRLLAQHPHVQITAVCGSSSAGQPLHEAREIARGDVDGAGRGVAVSRRAHIELREERRAVAQRAAPCLADRDCTRQASSSAGNLGDDVDEELIVGNSKLL